MTKMSVSFSLSKEQMFKLEYLVKLYNYKTPSQLIQDWVDYEYNNTLEGLKQHRDKIKQEIEKYDNRIKEIESTKSNKV